MFIDRVAEWGGVGRHSAHILKFWYLGAKAGGMYILNLRVYIMTKTAEVGTGRKVKENGSVFPCFYKYFCSRIMKSSSFTEIQYFMSVFHVTVFNYFSYQADT